MIDDALVLRVERLRDGVEGLRSELKLRYGTAARPVTAPKLREQAAQLGERWLVEVGAREDVIGAVGQEVVADLSVEFQRLITFSEAATARKRYDTAVRAILRDFRTRVVVPLKQARHRAPPASQPSPVRTQAIGSVFIGQSFNTVDAKLNATISRFVEAFGFATVSGEKPRADSVSQKVRDRIESATYFLGLFTRRDRVKGRREWTTSAWIIDEKAYALANRKKLILLREEGVQSIGGIQGDYEYIEFNRNDVPDLFVKLVSVLRSLIDAAV